MTRATDDVARATHEWPIPAWRSPGHSYMPLAGRRGMPAGLPDAQKYWAPCNQTLGPRVTVATWFALPSGHAAVRLS